jgi:hypothetical protein
MVYDLDVECYLDDRYTTYVSMLGIPAIILFIVGIPIMSAVYVWSQRKNTHKNLVGRVFYRLMTVGLRPSHYLWRSMEKVRTSIVVFVLVYTGQYGPFIHVFAYSGVLTITHLFEVSMDPYRMIRVKDTKKADKKAEHVRGDEQFQNIFQKMKNYAVMVALGTIFMGSLQLGANSNKQWRQRWWIDWNTLNDVVAYITVLGNIMFLIWLVNTVSHQFHWSFCCCNNKKKHKTKIASITPELQQRRNSASAKVLKSLSSAKVGQRASALTAWKKSADHAAAGARLMALAKSVEKTPPTKVVPKPSEDVVIQHVIDAGKQFNTKKKSPAEITREHLLELAKQARVRVRRKRTKKVKIKRKKNQTIDTTKEGEEGEKGEVEGSGAKEESKIPVTPVIDIKEEKIEATTAVKAEAKATVNTTDSNKKTKKKIIMPDSDSDHEDDSEKTKKQVGSKEETLKKSDNTNEDTTTKKKKKKSRPKRPRSSKPGGAEKDATNQAKEDTEKQRLIGGRRKSYTTRVEM